MTNILRLSIVLAIVTIIAGFVLAEIFTITKPRIELQKQAKTNEALRKVLPEAELIIPVERKVPVTDAEGHVLYEKTEVEYYKGYASQDTSNIVGYAFKAEGMGYSSVIETMVGIKPSGEIIKIEIISQKETPGLGAKCVEDKPFKGDSWSTRQFIGKSIESLKVDKDGGPIVSITGSTITSRAITNSIRESMKQILSKIDTSAQQQIGE
ncbi:MAG: RnfABCDGE type electron transport complex subunit G [Calditrichia bacterium]